MDAWCDDGGRCPPAWAKWTDGIYHYHRDLAKAGPAPTPSGCMSTLPTYSLIDNALHIEELDFLESGMPPSRLGYPMSLKTPNMGNPGYILHNPFIQPKA